MVKPNLFQRSNPWVKTIFQMTRTVAKLPKRRNTTTEQNDVKEEKTKHIDKEHK